MKRNYFTKAIFAIAVMLFCATSIGLRADAAETPFVPTADMASSPILGINNDGYYAATNGLAYASFVTPAEGGYVEVEYKNISIDAWAYAVVCTEIGEELAKDDCGQAGSLVFQFRSEPGKRNASKLEPNTRYYIRIGNQNKAGNIKLVIRFRPDANPDGKEQAEEIQLNTEYTRTIDGCVGSDSDDDYFKFTAVTSGAHHFTFKNACNGRVNYCVRKWGSDEYVKTTSNHDMNEGTYGGDVSEFDIILEAGQTYYLNVWFGKVGTYTFSFNNQSVQSIVMPAAAITLNRGQEHTLNPTVAPEGAYNKKLKYSTDNEGVAYVNSETGAISARGAGKAVITAAATDGSNTTATCVVYVTPDKPSVPYSEKTTSKYINLKWYTVSGASGYEVYQKSGKKWKKIKDTTTTAVKVKKLKAGTKYQFKIKAYVNADGKKYSVDSDIAKLATVPKKTSVTSVSKVRNTSNRYGTYYKIQVKWKKVSGATSYRVYYKAPGSSYKTYQTETKKTSVTMQFYRSKTAIGSRTYTFYVVPVKKYNNLSYSGAYSKGKSYRLH